jgi:hypothetical protein
METNVSFVAQLFGHVFFTHSLNPILKQFYN